MQRQNERQDGFIRRGESRPDNECRILVSSRTPVAMQCSTWTLVDWKPVKRLNKRDPCWCRPGAGVRRGRGLQTTDRPDRLGPAERFPQLQGASQCPSPPVTQESPIPGTVDGTGSPPVVIDRCGIFFPARRQRMNVEVAEDNPAPPPRTIPKVPCSVGCLRQSTGSLRREGLHSKRATVGGAGQQQRTTNKTARRLGFRFTLPKRQSGWFFHLGRRGSSSRRVRSNKWTDP